MNVAGNPVPLISGQMTGTLPASWGLRATQPRSSDGQMAAREVFRGACSSCHQLFPNDSICKPVTETGIEAT